MGTGKKPQRKVEVPKDWWNRLATYCNQSFGTNTAQDVYEFTQISRKTFFNAIKSDQFTEAKFSELVSRLGCRTQDELLCILGPPTIPLAPEMPSLMIEHLDESLLTDYLTGMGFAECMGSEEDWQAASVHGRDWIREHPEDIYCRAMLLWSTVKKGKPGEMIQMLNEISTWLASPLPSPTELNAQWNSAMWRSIIERKIEQLNGRTTEYYDFARWHLEDTLVKAALKRSIRLEESSQLRKEFFGLGRNLSNEHVMKKLIDGAKSQAGDGWVATAVGQAHQWANFELENGLARFSLVWFTGRQGHVGRIQFVVEQTCGWLDRNPNQIFVRWAMTWLAGLCPYGAALSRAIEETSLWLDAASSDDERLVRMGFLWLVGAKGSMTQVQQAITQTQTWLREHPEDDYIRVAYLLFLIRRRGTLRQRQRVIAEAREWLGSHSDIYDLTAAATRLCESAPI